ncbi:hypothetical protein [Paenibacillus zeisoli]|nr:hypothetical protein [Paenibacillus zeisoli]
MGFGSAEDVWYTVGFYVLLAVGIIGLGGWLMWLNKKAKNSKR